MALLIAGLALFLGVHLIPTIPALRTGLYEQLGDRRYRGAFSIVSLVGLVVIVMGYRSAGEAGSVQLFAPVPAAIVIAPYAMVVAFVLFAAANMRGHVRRNLQHPMLLGLLLWSLVHLLANGDLRATVLFGAFLAYAIVDLASAVGRRAVKSFEPQLRHDGIAVAAGVAVAIAFMLFHRMLFGVPAVPFSL